MSIDISLHCDECGKEIDTSELVFCEDCDVELKDRIEELLGVVEELEKEIEQLEK